MPAPTGEKLVADNRRARYEYNLLERVEAGIVLTGTEVKSLREGRVTLTQAYAEVRDGEVWLYGMSIAIYDKGGHANHEPDRPRKLLLHRKEIEKLAAKTKEGGLTIVPLSLYFKDGKAKVEIGLARGKKDWDKRQSLAEQQAKREMARALRHRHR
jgi:SsrA-binding protein